MSPEKAKNNPEFDMKGAAEFLNRCFEYGDTALDHSKILSQIPQPILLDFNNVLANNYTPLILNPHAKDFLSELNPMGNIIILTSASGWNEVNTFLTKNDLWDDKKILMTLPTWQFAFNFSRDAKADALYNKYIDLRNHPQITKDAFLNTDWSKKVAPLFMKNYDVPLIDDRRENTDNNPGIFGINVEPFEPVDELPYSGETLKVALEKVSNYHKSLDNPHIFPGS